MEDATFHHVGVIVDAVEPSILMWQGLGYQPTLRILDPVQKAHIVLLERPGAPMIELVSPDGPDSPAQSWIRRIKAGPYHTCFEVTSMTTALARLRGKGFMVVMEPVPAVAFNGRHVAFTWSKETGLLELLER
jgi:methylmalonyl-CoA/ethylmalonyl-CoA epimerase